MKPSSKCKVHGYTENVIANSNGYGYLCKTCVYSYHKKWRDSHPAYIAKLRERARGSYKKYSEKILHKQAEKCRIAREGRKLEKLENPTVKCKIHGITPLVYRKGFTKKYKFPKYVCKLCRDLKQKHTRIEKRKNKDVLCSQAAQKPKVEPVSKKWSRK